MERVGIFGGSFDPPHRAHGIVALRACEELKLDRLLWIPSGQPPHKDATSLSDVHHRVEMTRLMTDKDSRFHLELGEVSSPVFRGRSLPSNDCAPLDLIGTFF